MVTLVEHESRAAHPRERPDVLIGTAGVPYVIERGRGWLRSNEERDERSNDER